MKQWLGGWYTRSGKFSYLRFWAMVERRAGVGGLCSGRDAELVVVGTGAVLFERAWGPGVNGPCGPSTFAASTAGAYGLSKLVGTASAANTRLRSLRRYVPESSGRGYVACLHHPVNFNIGSTAEN